MVLSGCGGFAWRADRLGYLRASLCGQRAARNKPVGQLVAASGHCGATLRGIRDRGKHRRKIAEKGADPWRNLLAAGDCPGLYLRLRCRNRLRNWNVDLRRAWRTDRAKSLVLDCSRNRLDGIWPCRRYRLWYCRNVHEENAVRDARRRRRRRTWRNGVQSDGDTDRWGRGEPGGWIRFGRTSDRRGGGIGRERAERSLAVRHSGTVGRQPIYFVQAANHRG